MRRALDERVPPAGARRPAPGTPPRDRAAQVLALQARVGNAVVSRMIQRTVMDAPGNRKVWEDQDGRQSVLVPIDPGLVVAPMYVHHFTGMYLAVELGDARGSYPAIGTTTGEPGGVFVEMYRAPAVSGDLAVMRSDPGPATDYYWTGDKSKADELDLDPARHFGGGWAYGAIGWTMVFSAGGVKLFKRTAALNRNLQPPKLGHGGRKQALPVAQWNEQRKKQKGGYPLGGDKPLGVQPTEAGPRGSTKGAMGNQSANTVAAAAGRTLAGRQPYEWCHLIGHGEGGAEHQDNLVAATRSANTEQLAIEQAYRAVRKKGHPINAKVTAYTLAGHDDVADSFRYKLVDARDNRVIVDRRIDGESQHFGLAEFRLLSKHVSEQLEAHFARPWPPRSRWWPF